MEKGFGRRNVGLNEDGCEGQHATELDRVEWCHHWC